MQKWIKIIPAEFTFADKEYFIARLGLNGSVDFYSRLKNGKIRWSSKPSLAIRFMGGWKLLAMLEKHSNLVVIEIPKKFKF